MLVNTARSTSALPRFADPSQTPRKVSRQGGAAPSFGKATKPQSTPRSYVNAVTVEIVAIHDQVAEMQADPEHDGIVLGLVTIGLSHDLLELDGSSQCIDCTDKLDQGAVTRELDQPSTVARQCRLDVFSAMCLQSGQSSAFVSAHQTRVANDIRCQNGRQSPYNPLAGQEASATATR
jgi:hypothetical protein